MFKRLMDNSFLTQNPMMKQHMIELALKLHRALYQNKNELVKVQDERCRKNLTSQPVYRNGRYFLTS